MSSVQIGRISYRRSHLAIHESIRYANDASSANHCKLGAIKHNWPRWRFAQVFGISVRTRHDRCSDR